MNEVSISMAVIGFVLGSIQYQLRIKWQDAKENILIAVRPYYGDAERGFMSLYTAIYHIKKDLRTNIPEKQKKEFKKCLAEYDSAKIWLRFWGIIVPLMGLGLYAIYKVFNCKS
ncbi:MAG: hypothetical protein KJ619_06490 [Candidatus Omnitrophica bacterium]|nr:hypothetical protein [Candidatus Omnitrophota bacterium]MBU2473632.1 hypothetical protein [Candidatus Omnitrophota bacterium]